VRRYAVRRSTRRSRLALAAVAGGALAVVPLVLSTYATEQLTELELLLQRKELARLLEEFRRELAAQIADRLTEGGSLRRRTGDEDLLGVGPANVRGRARKGTRGFGLPMQAVRASSPLDARPPQTATHTSQRRDVRRCGSAQRTRP
jgi:hypothetical protein